MAAADLIQIDPAALELIEQRMGRLTRSVRRSVRADLGSAPKVDESYNHFVGRWDERLGQMFDNLEKIGDAIRTIRESFQDVDSNLAKQLGNDGQRSCSD